MSPAIVLVRGGSLRGNSLRPRYSGADVEWRARVLPPFAQGSLQLHELTDNIIAASREHHHRLYSSETALHKAARAVIISRQNSSSSSMSSMDSDSDRGFAGSRCVCRATVPCKGAVRACLWREHYGGLVYWCMGFCKELFINPGICGTSLALGVLEVEKSCQKCCLPNGCREAGRDITSAATICNPPPPFSPSPPLDTRGACPTRVGSTVPTWGRPGTAVCKVHTPQPLRPLQEQVGTGCEDRATQPPPHNVTGGGRPLFLQLCLPAPAIRGAPRPSPRTRHAATLPHSVCFELAVIGCALTYGTHRTCCRAALSPLVEVG